MPKIPYSGDDPLILVNITLSKIALIGIELLGNLHKNIVAVYQEVGDVLIGRAVLDEYK